MHAWLDDSDDHLRWLAPTDLNLDYMGITHLDCVTLVLVEKKAAPILFELSLTLKFSFLASFAAFIIACEHSVSSLVEYEHT